MKDQEEIEADIEPAYEGLGFERIFYPVARPQDTIAVDQEVVEDQTDRINFNERDRKRFELLRDVHEMDDFRTEEDSGHREDGPRTHCRRDGGKDGMG